MRFYHKTRPGEPTLPEFRSGKELGLESSLV